MSIYCIAWQSMVLGKLVNLEWSKNQKYKIGRQRNYNNNETYKVKTGRTKLYIYKP